MAAVPSELPARRHLAWLGDFLATERQAWIFVGKCLLAFYIAAWLSMLFQLEQPSTTMITVSIVMHPHSGMVLAKSFYRAIGTCAGSLCGVLLMAAFPQQRELFLLSLSLWVGLCAGGAVLYRNFMSYGFVLAGYTAAIVALPAISNPYNVFDSAMMRVNSWKRVKRSNSSGSKPSLCWASGVCMWAAACICDSAWISISRNCARSRSTLSVSSCMVLFRPRNSPSMRLRAMDTSPVWLTIAI